MLGISITALRPYKPSSSDWMFSHFPLYLQHIDLTMGYQMNKGNLHTMTPMSRELTPVPTSSARAHGTPRVQPEALSEQRSDPSRGKSEV